MQDIIPLILFTYPGAFAEFTYWHFAKDKEFYKEPDAYFRAARVFFLSAVVTLVSLFASTLLYHTTIDLSTVVSFLNTGNHAIWYALISLCTSVLTGLGWFGCAYLWEKISNHFRLSRGKAPASERNHTWMSMLADPDTPQMDYVLEIKKHGQVMKRGFIMHMPNDIRKDTGFVLMHCDLVEEVLNTKDQDLISDPLISYVDIGTETEIVMRDAVKFGAWLLGKYPPKKDD